MCILSPAAGGKTAHNGHHQRVGKSAASTRFGGGSTMKAVLVRTFVCAALLVLTPRLAMTQEVTLSGTITDATEAVLPGATVTAIHVASGNSFVGVTDPTGEYRIGQMRPGIYKVTAELSGFSSV